MATTRGDMKSSLKRFDRGQMYHSPRAEDSQRNVAMLFTWISVALVFQGAERGDNAETSFRRLDDGIDVALLGSDERVGEAVAKFGDFFLAKTIPIGLGDFVQFALVDDVHGALRTHYSNFGGGPCEVGVGADVLAGHDAIRAAVRFAGYDRDFRDGGFREGKKKLRAVLDDPAKLLLRPGQKAGNVFKGDEWNIEGVAETDEAGALERSV